MKARRGGGLQDKERDQASHHCRSGIPNSYTLRLARPSYHPLQDGKNIYVVGTKQFWFLCAMASVYGGAICANDIMYIGKYVIHNCYKRCCNNKPVPCQRIVTMVLVTVLNLFLHGFCLYAVANTVATSTSLSSGLSSFATLFIVLELDQKVAEALNISASNSAGQQQPQKSSIFQALTPSLMSPRGPGETDK